MSTSFVSKEAAEKNRKWFVVDAENVTLGRLASEVAAVLRGKNKPEFTRHTDCGDYVIVVNAAKVKLTGNKLQDKMYHQHTGFIGNVRSNSAGQLLASHPERVIEAAVYGMLPKGVLGKHTRKKLKVFAGPEHTHKAQTPVKLELRYVKAA